MLAPQSRMRGAGTSLSKASDCWTKMSFHCGHVDMASTYSNRYGGTAICPGVLRGSCTARHSSCRTTASSGVGQMSCWTSRARRLKCVSNGDKGLGANHRTRSPCVDFVGPAHRRLFRPIEPRVDGFDALGEAVILVRHFVFPGAKSSATVHVARLKR